jgi:hypothetical protein
MDILGKVSGGVVVLEDAKALPDGTVVRVEPLKDRAAPERPDRGAGTRPADAEDGKPPEGEESLAEMLLSLAGTVKGLPEDMALNHDHYLYGLPKKKK